jgi:integrase
MSAYMKRAKLTATVVERFTCPAGKQQAFAWDATVPELGLRATAAGSKAFIFQSRYHGRSLRMTIGSVGTWSISAAQKRARDLQRQIDEGRDPREVKAEVVAADVARRRKEAGELVTVADAWAVYLAEGKPKRKDAWKPRYLADLHKAAARGGEPRKRGAGVTKPGHLWPLMSRRLVEINSETVRDWFIRERKRGPIQAARAVAMLAGFLGWCATRPEFRAYVDKDCTRAPEVVRLLPATRRRSDALDESQLAAWFVGTDKLPNRTARALLQALLLTGARREEMAALKWKDVDLRWRRLTIADKVGDFRVIPLTPYLAALIESLPTLREPGGRPIEFVFASLTAASRRIVEPRSPHQFVLADAGIPHVSIHGLRRSFALMGEAAGAPAGAIAQIMGHRPSAVAEGYKPRSVDALREHANRIEAFILAKAGIVFDPDAATAGPLRVVGGTELTGGQAMR